MDGIAAMSTEEIIGLVTEFKDGDESAFERLVEVLRYQVHALAYRLTGRHDIADEIAQESFLKIYFKIQRLEQVSSFPYWWHRIVFNLANDYFRRKKREADAIQNYREVLEKKETLSQKNKLSIMPLLLELIDELPEKQKRVFILRELEDMPHREIAKMLKIPEGTVWSRLSQARTKLQKKVKGFI